MTDEQTIAATLDRLGFELERAECRLQRRAVRKVALGLVPVLVLIVVLVAAVVGYRGQASNAAGKSTTFDLRTVISAFGDDASALTPGSSAEQRTVNRLREGLATLPGGNLVPAHANLDTKRFRLLARNLGSKREMIAAAPSLDGSRACLSVGDEQDGPVVKYCWAPHGDSQHFVAYTPWISFSGTPLMMVVGLAYDDVASLRVMIDGAWRAVPITNNAFLLEVPGPNDPKRITTIEATLRSGEIQTAQPSSGM